jgi:hypothetical protein
MAAFSRNALTTRATPFAIIPRHPLIASRIHASPYTDFVKIIHAHEMITSASYAIQWHFLRASPMHTPPVSILHHPCTNHPALYHTSCIIPAQTASLVILHHPSKSSPFLTVRTSRNHYHQCDGLSSAKSTGYTITQARVENGVCTLDCSRTCEQNL